MTGWLAAQPHMDVLYVSYNEVLREPRPHAERIDAFLGGGLDVDRMVSVVDAQLHRQRA